MRRYQGQARKSGVSAGRGVRVPSAGHPRARTFQAAREAGAKSTWSIRRTSSLGASRRGPGGTSGHSPDLPVTWRAFRLPGASRRRCWRAQALRSSRWCCSPPRRSVAGVHHLIVGGHEVPAVPVERSEPHRRREVGPRVLTRIYTEALAKEVGQIQRNLLPSNHHVRSELGGRLGQLGTGILELKVKGLTGGHGTADLTCTDPW